MYKNLKSLALSVAEILHGVQNSKTGHVTLTTHTYGTVVLVEHRLVTDTDTDGHGAITYIESYTIIISLQSYFYYWYSITHSLFHSRLKSFLFCESSLPQPFLCLLQNSLYGFPRLFTATSEHICLFTF